MIDREIEKKSTTTLAEMRSLTMEREGGREESKTGEQRSITMDRASGGEVCHYGDIKWKIGGSLWGCAVKERSTTMKMESRGDEQHYGEGSSSR